MASDLAGGDLRLEAATLLIIAGYFCGLDLTPSAVLWTVEQNPAGPAAQKLAQIEARLREARAQALREGCAAVCEWCRKGRAVALRGTGVYYHPQEVGGSRYIALAENCAARDIHALLAAEADHHNGGEPGAGEGGGGGE